MTDVQRYTATVTERADGSWFIDLGLGYDNPVYDFCWGGVAEFLSNSHTHEITAIRIAMNKED